MNALDSLYIDESTFQSLYAERDGLSSTLDESADRIVMLEKEAREQDSIVSIHTNKD